jgi:hypothetical protein
MSFGEMPRIAAAQGGGLFAGTPEILPGDRTRGTKAQLSGG